MKLFWKVFFSTMFISAICVMVSGYVIIHTNFRSQLAREVNVSRAYGDVVYYALASEYADVQRFSPAEMTRGEVVDAISRIAYSVSADMMKQEILFAVLDENGKALFTALPVSLDREMLGSLRVDRAGWTIREAGNSFYIQTIRPAVCGSALFYVEILRDVSQIYQNQRAQYETLMAMMVAMIFVVGALTSVITRWLLRQVVELTKTTEAIADGDLGERARPRGQDEISLLADHFNRMADRLAVKMEELKDEATRKERFVGAFSHELKTPLTSIIGYADLLRRREMGAEQRHICAEYIFNEGKRLETLSMRLLDLLVLRDHTLHKTAADIQGIVGEVVSVVEPQLSAAHIGVSYTIEPARIPMEAPLMKTVLFNLIDNARKAIPRDGSIEILGEYGPDGYALRIRDTGRGMAPQELGKITEAFYMVDRSRARMQGGAGLGLSICDEILRAHGFALSFESQLDVGTTVTITMGEGQG